ncbi:MAG: MATE family efflux transporter [Christensenella sp.]|uniref:MATE family efflux transporter n=1 Tax=Christensenella sp. TaxID=1935934 RepID=UPI002B206358|nr:MATE family efflux transporter [Christensenella sp.]MEA5003570.1 MATE family efflux transporter [Christensenella sp.]
MNQTIQDFTSGNMARQMLRFAWPLFLANLLQSLYSIVDMVVVGQFVGSEGLAALSSASMIVFVITSLCTGITTGGAVLVAQFEGARDKQQRAQTIGTLFTLSMLLSALITVVSLLAYRPLLTLMQLPKEAMQYADDYMNVVCMGTAFVFGYNAVCAVLRGMGDSKHPLYFVLAATIVNIVLDLLLVGGLHMGTKGAAIATVASQGISFLLAAIHLKRSGLAKGAYAGGRFLKKTAKLILKIGLPTAGQMAILNLSYLIATGMLNVFGVAVAAASGIGLKLNTFAAMPIWAVGQAMTTITGQVMGAGNVARAEAAAKTGAKLCVAAAAITTVIFQLFAPQLVMLFNTDPAVISEGILYLRICCGLNCIVYAVMYAFNSFATGVGDAMFAFLNSMLDCLVIRIAGSLILGFALGYGFVGVYVAEMLAPVPPAIVAAVYFFRGRWKTRRLVSL